MSLISRTVHVTGLPVGYSDSSLQNKLETHGIIQCIVSPTSDSAYVVFSKDESVESALVCDGTDFEDGILTVKQCTLARSKELEGLVTMQSSSHSSIVSPMQGEITLLCNQLAGLSPDALKSVLGFVQNIVQTSEATIANDNMNTYLAQGSSRISQFYSLNPELPSSNTGLPSSTPGLPSSTPQLLSSGPRLPNSYPGMHSYDSGLPNPNQVLPSSGQGLPSITPGLTNHNLGFINSIPGVPSSIANVPMPGVYQAPRISSFSGESQKGDISFELWKSEVVSLKDAGYSEASILYAIRKSLKGRAAELLLSVGCSVSINQIFDKLHRIFGTVSTPELLLEHYYNSRQMPGETVATWACRLDDMLRQLQDLGCPIVSQVVAMLRSKFWSGLQDQAVKNAVRHLHDTNASYENILLAARRAELEMNTKVSNPVVANQSTSQPPSNQMLYDAIVKLNKRMDELGRQRHNPNQSFRGKCYNCHVVGHRKADCPRNVHNSSNSSPNLNAENL